jgi:hypothetical protein
MISNFRHTANQQRTRAAWTAKKKAAPKGGLECSRVHDRYRFLIDQNVLERTSSVGVGGVCTDVPDTTPMYRLPFSSTTTGVGEGR